MSIAKATAGTDIFEEMLGDINYPADSKAGKTFPFKMRCGVIKRRPPRHEFFEFILNMGKVNIDPIMNHQSFTEDGPLNLTFVFPERWMGVKEQQDFMYAMALHPDVERIKSVDVITSSPLIVGNFFKEQVRILTWADDPE